MTAKSRGSVGSSIGAVVLGVGAFIVGVPQTARSEPGAAQTAPQMDRRQEIALALSACPPPVAGKAAVYVRGASGYVKVRESENGFTAITSFALGQVAPICMDQEGARTDLPRMLKTAELQAQGKGPDEIKRYVAEAYASGALQPPARPGISYMLSPENRLLNEKGVVGPFPPHVMVYAPYLTNAAIGAGRDLLPDGNLAGPATVFAEGTPRAMIIIPVGPHADHIHPASQP